ncbi:MAG: signal peptidase I [Ktedonobacterales bacterium]
MEDAQLLPAERNAAKAALKKKNTSRSRFAREMIETVVLTALVFFAVRAAVHPFQVDGPSMQPGLHTNDYVLVSTLAYFFSSPQRGDVIVFHPPDDPSQDYVKRVIAIPGDRVDITATAVYVDGYKLNEPYIAPLRPGQSENPDVLTDITLGPNDYFVLGDNRLESIDSRIFGSVPRRNIIGKAELVMWPGNEIHTISTYSSVFASIKH